MQSVKISCAVILMTTLMACSSDSDTSDSTQTLPWAACESGSSLECAELDVPMDYTNPDGETISLALIRMPATGNDKQGVILLNPGGPGGSGIELVEDFSLIGNIPEDITAAFDIIGFDPRGIGNSTPADCNNLGLNDITFYPTNADAIRQMHEDSIAFGAACFEKVGPYLQQLGSLNVVRDMNEIRMAMGENTLNFIGYSYGTRLAALYLQQFPTHSGRFILDGSLPPDSSVRKLITEQTPAYESNLRAVLSQCRLTDNNCDVDQLMSNAANRALELANDFSGPAQDEFALLAEIVSQSTEDPEFGVFAADTLIEYFTAPDIRILERFFTLLMQLQGAGDDDSDNDEDIAQKAVMCADDSARPSADELINLLSDLNSISDIFAEAQVAEAATCAGWPEALEPLPQISSDTAPVSLVVGGTTDAQTPLAWSQEMAQAIGGFFIQSEHPGHTSVFNGDSDCIDTIAEQFLLDGLAPAVSECGSNTE